ncbi:efflux RND transporter periplasmic adaptor subunit [Oxalobacteraceae bacterium CAVE-383]|nr:efflux RND transporter periplasmic adaptor subunit [Oxalobacteraceae bacterium CAVE-383]
MIGAIALAVIVAIGGAAAMMHRSAGAAKAAAASKAAAPALTVTSAAPRRLDWPTVLEASGAIAAWQEASIGTQIGGYQLIDVLVNVGDQVKKGQVLARLDPALLLAEQTQLQANLDQAEANRKRMQSLQGSGGVSDQDILQFVTQAKTAAAQLASKQLQLRYANVVAPDDGVISSRTATLGAVAPVGQELFRLIRRNRLEWRGELTAAQLPHIGIGQQIALTLPDGSNAVARVRQTAPSLDSQSRLGIVYADVAPGSLARAGMYASGRVALGQSPALAIPAQSVIIRDGRSYVLKLADNSATPKVSLQAVTVGRRSGTDAEIVQGLGDGDRIVVQGAGFLNDGDIVRLADNAAAGK